jgi:hypothetical protein
MLTAPSLLSRQAAKARVTSADIEMSPVRMDDEAGDSCVGARL